MVQQVDDEDDDPDAPLPPPSIHRVYTVHHGGSETNGDDIDDGSLEYEYESYNVINKMKTMYTRRG